MRRLGLLLALLVLGGAPAPARACSGPCGNERFFVLSAETTSPVPRDGALVVWGGASGETCRDELAPNIDFAVWHAGEPVPGTTDIPGGTGLFVFVPDDPWLPEASYTATLTIDNSKIAPPLDAWCAITEDSISESFEFVTSADLGPQLPMLPPPTFTTLTGPITNRFDAIVCCPASAPESDDSAGCDGALQWFAPDVCAYLFEETILGISMGEWTPPPALAGQVLYELFVADALAARGTEIEYIGALRSAGTCARLRATHLGTREFVDSPVACAPPEQVAALGVHPRDVAAELACADAVLCGASGDEWDPQACSPFDPQVPPAAPVLPARESILDTACPGLRGHGKPAVEGSTGGSESGEASGSDELADRDGCGCTATPRQPGALALILLVLATGRRRRP